MGSGAPCKRKIRGASLGAKQNQNQPATVLSHKHAHELTTWRHVFVKVRALARTHTLWACTSLTIDSVFQFSNLHHKSRVSEEAAVAGSKHEPELRTLALRWTGTFRTGVSFSSTDLKNLQREKKKWSKLTSNASHIGTSKHAISPFMQNPCISILIMLCTTL